MKIRFIFWVLYLLIFPFYLFPPGSVQIADLFGILFILSSINSIIGMFKNFKFMKLLLLFVIYTFIVNTFWALILDDAIFYKSSINYLYAFLLLSSVVANFNDKRFLKLTFVALVSCLLLQLATMAFAGRTWGFRTVLYFNNPNQLALWSINMLILVNVIGSNLKIKDTKIELISLIISFFGILSASKIVLVSLVFYWGYVMLRQGGGARKKIIIFLVLLIGLFNINTIIKLNAINNVVQRMQTDNLGDDNLEGRGFDRIWNNPEYLLFGAGDGITERFDSKYKGELHSTFFSIFFCYGIIGIGLVGLFLKVVMSNKTNVRPFILMAILVSFTIGHMTFRIPLFWIALTSIYFLDNKKLNEKLDVRNKRINN